MTYRRQLIDLGVIVPRAQRRPALYDARPYLAQDDWGYHAAADDIRWNGGRVPPELEEKING